MKFAKICVFAAAVAVAVSAFADAGNTLIYFSTPEPTALYKGDTYATGDVVLDGEWYALVWSKDGKFGGLTLDCAPARAGDAVVLMAQLAKGGHCPQTVFQIDSKDAVAYENGVFEVYLLDTRSADGKSVSAPGANDKPTTVNGAVVSTRYLSASAAQGGAGEGAAVAGSWDPSKIDVNVEGFKPASIAAITPVGASVRLTLANLLPGVKYNIRKGATPSNLPNYAFEVPVTSEKVTVTVDNPENDNFFQLVREPLKK